MNLSLRELGGLPCPRNVNGLGAGELGLMTRGDVGLGTEDDGLGDVKLRTCGWLGVGRLVGAEKPRNSFGTLGGAEARAGLREGAGWLGI